jgi:hypothetical protein
MPRNTAFYLPTLKNQFNLSFWGWSHEDLEIFRLEILYNHNYSTMKNRLKSIRVKGKKRSLRARMTKPRSSIILATALPIPAVAMPIEVKHQKIDTPELEPIHQVELVAKSSHILGESGLAIYLVSQNKSESESKRYLIRITNFLIWSYYDKNLVNIVPTQESILNWFAIILNEEYNCLLAYCVYLQNQKQLAPTTIVSYIADILFCCEWLTFFAPHAIRSTVNNIGGIDKVAENIRLAQSKIKRRSRSEISEESKIRHRLLPEGGLAELQAKVMAIIVVFRALPNMHNLDAVSYRRFMALLFATIYLFSPNGRQSGLQDMRLGQVPQVKQRGFATSRVFKTNHKYGLQPLTFSEVSLEMLILYVDVVRPQVALTHPSQDAESLWLTYTGQSERQIGKLITSFFVRECGQHITITAIRSLVETTMHKKMMKGTITAEQRAAVMNINGHSSATVNDYYLQEQRIDDVYNARLAWDAPAGPPVLPLPVPAAALHTAAVAVDASSDIDDADMIEGLVDDWEEDASPVRPAVAHKTPPASPAAAWSPFDPRHRHSEPVSPFVAADWGRDHPDIKFPNTKARWTSAEKDYVRIWCGNFKIQYPDANNVVAKCLKHMRNDPTALRIFHPYHTLNSARLRWGYDNSDK